MPIQFPLIAVVAGGSSAGGFATVATTAAIVSYFANRTAILDAYAAANGTTAASLTPSQIALAQDAWRHTYVSAKLAQKFGSGNAETLGNLWEETFPNNSGDKNMDLWNNDVGRDIGANSSTDSQLLQNIFDAMATGDLILDPSDPRDFQETTSNVSDLSNLGEMNLQDAFADELSDIDQYIDDVLNGNYGNDGQSPGQPENPGDPGYPAFPFEGLEGPWRKWRDFIDPAEKAFTPLVLDLDGSGTIDLITLENSISFLAGTALISSMAVMTMIF